MCPFVKNINDFPILEYNIDTLHTACCMLIPLKYKAIILYCEGVDSDWLDEIAEAVEDVYPDITVLWVHPDEPRYIKGQPTPNPGVPILIIQNKQELMDAKAQLRKTQYYSHWKE